MKTKITGKVVRASSISAREHNAPKAAADGFEELMAEVEELFGVDILPGDCDLAKRMPKFRKILAALAANKPKAAKL